MSVADREAAGIETLPSNLLDATRELARDDALRAGFGTVGDGSDYLDYFIECKQREVTAAHEQITDWELGATCSCSNPAEPPPPLQVNS